jgi:hypothetical protein
MIENLCTLNILSVLVSFNIFLCSCLIQKFVYIATQKVKYQFVMFCVLCCAWKYCDKGIMRCSFPFPLRKSFYNPFQLKTKWKFVSTYFFFSFLLSHNFCQWQFRIVIISQCIKSSNPHSSFQWFFEITSWAKWCACVVSSSQF